VNEAPIIIAFDHVVHYIIEHFFHSFGIVSLVIKLSFEETYYDEYSISRVGAGSEVRILRKARKGNCG
jgi:hypothetical protein